MTSQDEILISINLLFYLPTISSKQGKTCKKMRNKTGNCGMNKERGFQDVRYKRG